MANEQMANEQYLTGQFTGQFTGQLGLSFCRALNALKEGKRVKRLGWNSQNQYLELQKPDLNSKMTLPYIYIKTAKGDIVPWVASQTDILSDDWEVGF